MQWQPISTLPRDFEGYDVWNDILGRVPNCYIGLTTYGRELGVVYQSSYDCDGPVMNLVPSPTHWIKIDPPEQEPANDE